MPGAEYNASPSAERGIFGAAPIVIAGVAIALANIGSTVVVARLLVPREYGALTQLLGLFFILSMPGSALMVGVVHRVAAWRIAGDDHRLKPWLGRVEVICFGALILFMAAVWILQGRISGWLSLPSRAGVFETLVAGALWVIVSVNRGVLQARKEYRWLGWNLAIEGMTRTVFMIGLAAAGLGLTGAAMGILLGEAVALAHGLAGAFRGMPGAFRRLAASSIRVPGAFRGAAERQGQPDSIGREHGRSIHGRRELAGDVFTAFMSLGLLAILQYMDVVMVGAYSPSRAGDYGAISVSAKSLVFWTIMLTNYLLPEATIRWRLGGHALNELRNTLVLALLPALFMLAIALTAPLQFLGIAFGGNLEGAASGFPYLVGAMAFLSVTIILTNYFFGVAWRGIPVVLAVGAGALIVSIVSAGGRPLQTARMDLVVQACLAAAVVGCFVVLTRRHAQVRRGGLEVQPRESSLPGGFASPSEDLPGAV
ncbi:MAG: lipopolysaccharide biosynthesis protein [Acidimicrobiales bacterium]